MAADGVACGTCRIAYHHACLPDDEGRCPTCRLRFGEAEEAQADRDAVRDSALVRRGRTMLMFLLGSLAALGTAALFVNLSNQMLGVADVIRYVGELVLYYLVFSGVRWARAATAILLAVGAVLLTLAGLAFYAGGHMVAVFVVASAVLLSVLTVVALVASPSVRWFLIAQERKRLGQD
ncbi:MAG: hypothetical protein R3B99_36950 [Polyangiales bacterium]|nr:hypothetical protein [Myxococcales bacterium]MCB9624770.1 hypothetical protein [Sandaracinus sp.]